ncbi:putative Tic20 family protein [Scopulibacillus daqui]|uniref:Tic20 family protein n=1 Tax=Scopulibacillus daqui TaxID=1469162 RepID=A0ABS2PXY8_9BACL|nr:putative Tic20 family protein [Scopulibacillus daqui]
MRNETTAAIFTHISSFSIFIGIPFGNLIGPLVLWLIFRKQSELADENGKEAVNFQISIMIYFIISAILCLILIGFLLLLAVCIVWFIFVIIATVQASEGKVYRYPLTIRFIK